MTGYGTDDRSAGAPVRGRSSRDGIQRAWLLFGILVLGLAAMVAPRLAAAQPAQTLLMVPRVGFYGEGYEAAGGGFMATGVDADARAYVRPSRLAFASGGESVVRIRGIRWTAWNRRGARGVGVARDCSADGCARAIRVVVTLGRPASSWCQRPAGTARTFLHITFSFPSSRPVRLAYGTPDIGWTDCRIHH